MSNEDLDFIEKLENIIENAKSKTTNKLYTNKIRKRLAKTSLAKYTENIYCQKYVKERCHHLFSVSAEWYDNFIYKEPTDNLFTIYINIQLNEQTSDKIFRSYNDFTKYVHSDILADLSTVSKTLELSNEELVLLIYNILQIFY
jgi:hypothetical protein